VKVPFKGSYVASITHESVIELFEIRAVLEGLAARLAIPEITPDEITDLTRVVDSHEKALRNGAISEAAGYNRKFHQTIIQHCTNERLLQILGNLDDHLQRFRLLSNYQRGTALKSVEEHRQVLAALKNKTALQLSKLCANIFKMSWWIYLSRILTNWLIWSARWHRINLSSPRNNLNGK